MDLEQVIARLDRMYGPAAPVFTHDPFELVLWENVGYLIDDRKRQVAFETLRRRIGLSPASILAARDEELEAVAHLGGMHPHKRVLAWKESAQLAVELGDLCAVARQPLRQAVKAFQKFPSLGQPGAEKILLFSRSHPILPLESNGLRVLVRLGFGEESRSYGATYKSVREALTPIPADTDWLTGAHQQLRRHGQEICRRTMPSCEVCPLRRPCAYFAKAG